MTSECEVGWTRAELFWTWRPYFAALQHYLQCSIYSAFCQHEGHLLCDAAAGCFDDTR